MLRLGLPSGAPSTEVRPRGFSATDEEREALCKNWPWRLFTIFLQHGSELLVEVHPLVKQAGKKPSALPFRSLQRLAFQAQLTITWSGGKQDLSA